MIENLNVYSNGLNGEVTKDKIGAHRVEVAQSQQQRQYTKSNS